MSEHTKNKKENKPIKQTPAKPTKHNLLNGLFKGFLNAKTQDSQVSST